MILNMGKVLIMAIPVLSSSASVLYGVPQGSLLGPILSHKACFYWCLFLKIGINTWSLLNSPEDDVLIISPTNSAKQVS